VGVVDHTKWHRTGLLSFVPAQRIDAIITDEHSSAETVEQWRKRHVEVVTATVEDDLTRRPSNRA
jgi:DeoR/GlpR family transcriptional regulator of sugar metabolism